MIVNNVKKELLQHLSTLDKDFSSISLLLGYSAGIDSSVLVHILEILRSDFGFKLDLCHINHNFDKNSNLMMNHAKNIAELYNLKLYNYNYKYDGNSNFEASARKFRYSIFNKIKDEYKYDFIITAHHYDDNIETLEMRSDNKYSWTSMLGIKNKLRSVIRPLLSCSKQNIITYAQKNSIDYINDTSNDNISLLRNKVRLIDLPNKRLINPNYDKLLYKYHKNALARLDNLIDKINTSNLVKASNSHIIIIYKKRISKFSQNEIKVILQSLINDCFNQFITKTYGGWLNIFKYLNSNHKVNKFYQLDSKIRISTCAKYFYIDNIKNYPINQLSIKLDSNNYWHEYKFYVEKVNYFNESKDCTFIIIPFIVYKKGIFVRKWDYGDTIKINENKRKKISDVFIDSKVPLVVKENYPLVCSGDNEIIWIPGIRVTKTSKNSSNYIKISFEGNFLYD